MSRAATVMALVLVLAVAWPATGRAQGVDIAGISERVLQADPETLAEALQDPPPPGAVPAGFSVAEDGQAANQASAEGFLEGLDAFGGAVANVYHVLDTDRRVVPGAIGVGSMSYLLYDSVITDEQFAEFERLAREVFTAESGLDATVEQVDLGGAEGIHVVTTDHNDDVYTAANLFVVPVGNVLIFGLVLVADQRELDAQQLEHHTRELTLAAAGYLGQVADAVLELPAATPGDRRDKFDGRHSRWH